MGQRLNKITINTAVGVSYSFYPLGHETFESWLAGQQNPAMFVIHNPETNKGISIPKQSVVNIEYEYAEDA